MSFRPCLVIPVYNHSGPLAVLLPRLLVHQLPIFLVDDGSATEQHTQLVAMAARQPQLRLLHLETNQGKGAAVQHGLRAAANEGYSHALQIDADGQHDAADVPAFLRLAERRPDAVICGQAVFDDSVPKARRYGRWITHVWVWIETLSLDIADSMCGFRCYPLNRVVPLLDEEAIPSRMDFDTEILVRLYWRGAPVENLATRVTYPAGGRSHFDPWRDNLRISWMHTRLFFGMLRRLPRLLARRRRGSDAHWSRQRERGTRLGLAITALTWRYGGKRLTQLLLYGVVAWFFLANAGARRASLDYLARLQRHSGGVTPASSLLNAYKHMLAFGEAALDKLAGWAGDIDDLAVAFPEQAAFERLIASGRGALLIGAHLGNLEMTRAIANRSQRAVINAVVYSHHAPRYGELLERHNPQYGVNLLQVSAFGADTAIMLKEKIERGELLVIVGDRTPPAENGRVVQANFLGAPAAFAQGPYLLAALLECPVYLFFCLKHGDGYRIEFEPFADPLELPRAARQSALSAYAQRYAERLEHYCLTAPLQWFNFYDFWKAA